MSSSSRIAFRCGWSPTATAWLALALCPVLMAAATPILAQASVVKRQAWGARPAITERMRAQNLTGIMIHHTAVRQQARISLEKKMRGLQRFSQRPGRVSKRRKPAWGDVPYHFYIGVSGRIAEGRNLAYAGDTNTRYDTSGWIQIVVEGDFTKEQPTSAQIASLRRLTQNLKRKYNIPGSRISGHNDHASTNCPGPNLKRYLPSLR